MCGKKCNPFDSLPSSSISESLPVGISHFFSLFLVNFDHLLQMPASDDFEGTLSLYIDMYTYVCMYIGRNVVF